MTPVNYAFVKFVSWLILRLGFDLDVRGQHHVPREGSFVVASNHISFMDPVVLGVACPRRLRFMARSDLFGQIILGTFLRAVGVIPLRRGEHDVTAIKTALSTLRKGEAIGLFPEGTRQLTGKLGFAKRGVGLLAVSAQVPIVPALIQGTFEALPPHAKRFHRAKIRVAFGPMISYTTPTAQPLSGLSQEQAPRRNRQVSSSHHQQLADALTRQWHQLAEQFK